MKYDPNTGFGHAPHSPDDAMQTRPDALARRGPPGHVDTAIIGMSARYPKAGDWRAFWENLRAGRDCISEIPPERWDWRAHYDESRGTSGRSYTRWGGFLDDIDRFDPRFFWIAPSEAEHIDPQERLFLESAYLLIQDAGYTPANLSTSRRVGVFVGASNSSYSLVASQSQWTLANRVSHVFDFNGPSMVINSACSSSLSAIHVALESLATGTSDVAIAGGVNLIMHPSHYARLASVGMLSAGPHCRAFGADADGFVDGEGVGAVLLKPLQRALEDGDQIYGVIKGSALNAGGKTFRYTVPNPLAQGRLVAEAIARAGFAPQSIGCVEAHGSGTDFGDALEVRGLSEAFGATAGATPWCALGSVKSNIGHGEGVAGIAGLTKLILQMRHGQFAPSLHAQTLNPRIDFTGTPFTVQRELAPWPRPAGHPRRAGVSSFGAGGANAHLLIEEYVAPAAPAASVAANPDAPALIVLSAANPDRLHAVAQRLADFLDGEFGRDITLAELAYTLQVGREALSERLGFVAGSLAQVRVCLDAFLHDRDAGQLLLRTSVGRGRDGWTALLEDESFAATVRGWVERGKYDLLLNLWGQGQSLDWSMLYREARPRRVSLPGYPFEGERYWAPASVRYAGARRSRRRRPVAGPAAAVSSATSSATSSAPVSAASGVATPLAALQAQVRTVVAALLKVEPEEIESGQSIGDYGLDSIGLTHLANQLNLRFGSALQPTDFMELETASVERIARLLQQQLPIAGTTGTPARAQPHPPRDTQSTRSGPGSGPAPGGVPATHGVRATRHGDPLQEQVRQAVAALLKVDIEEVEPDLDISDYGVDSIGFTYLADRLNEQHGTRLRPTDFFELDQVSAIRIARLLRQALSTRDVSEAAQSLVAAGGR
ncbi:phosphopantetheine-binding protein [Paraburkholderia acidicola]|uniref:Phosphopantetheine-binding protein n=1 Tax=Paraburkholderia acidicola TaxID=1912599 RepID=A0ABV1LGG9_9BURK